MNCVTNLYTRRQKVITKIIIKTIIKKIIIYGIIGLPVQILQAYFYETDLHYISAILFYSFVFFVLFDIGRSIKNKNARKRYIIYVSIVVLQVVLITVLGNIFGFKTYVSPETENSLLDALSVFILLGTITGILIKIVYDCKNKYPVVKVLYFPIAMLVFSLFMTLITVF